jgi:biopolymer transport protein ExbD
VFRTPQALEINLPPDDQVQIDVPQSKVLQLRVLSEDRAYWKKGEVPWSRTDIKGLESIFKNYSSDKETIVLIKIDREAKFANMVDIIDGLDIAHLTRFSLDKLSDTEKAEVSTL